MGVSKRKEKHKTKSAIQCPTCKDIIVSLHRHDFLRCSCGECFIDGGNDYIRYGHEKLEPKVVVIKYSPHLIMTCREIPAVPSPKKEK